VVGKGSMSPVSSIPKLKSNTCSIVVIEEVSFLSSATVASCCMVSTQVLKELPEIKVAD